MSSLSKASHGALEAFRALNPFAAFGRSPEILEGRPLDRANDVPHAEGTEQSVLSPGGMARTLRSVASLLYIKGDNDNGGPQVDHIYSGKRPLRKSSTKSLRGLFHKKPPRRFSRASDDSHTSDPVQGGDFIQPPPYARNEAPNLDVHIPPTSTWAQNSGLLTGSGTMLIDPAELMLDDSPLLQQPQCTDQEAPRAMNIVFAANVCSPLAAVASIRDKQSADNTTPSPTASPTAQKFPLRGRLNMKKSLDRLHSKISRVLSPASPTRVVSLQPENDSSSRPDPDTPLGNMGLRHEWEAIRNQRKARYDAMMGYTQSTESDDVSDMDLKLRHVVAASDLCELPLYHMEQKCGHYGGGALRYSVAANERNCGPVLDNYSIRPTSSSGTSTTSPTQHNSDGVSTNSTLRSSCQSSNAECEPKVSPCASKNDIDRGRSFDRGSSARRSSSFNHPSRDSPFLPKAKVQNLKQTAPAKSSACSNVSEAMIGENDVDASAEKQAKNPDVAHAPKINNQFDQDPASAVSSLLCSTTSSAVDSTLSTADPGLTPHRLHQACMDKIVTPAEHLAHLQKVYAVHDPTNTEVYIPEINLTELGRNQREKFRTFAEAKMEWDRSQGFITGVFQLWDETTIHRDDLVQGCSMEAARARDQLDNLKASWNALRYLADLEDYEDAKRYDQNGNVMSDPMKGWDGEAVWEKNRLPFIDSEEEDHWDEDGLEEGELPSYWEDGWTCHQGTYDHGNGDHREDDPCVATQADADTAFEQHSSDSKEILPVNEAQTPAASDRRSPSWIADEQCIVHEVSPDSFSGLSIHSSPLVTDELIQGAYDSTRLGERSDDSTGEA